uniref:Uncharacterized protein n=1 Tax=Rhizophora mucronata TaxID=61149 RepID=A0A2P2PW22_RHIMU
MVILITMEKYIGKERTKTKKRKKRMRKMDWRMRNLGVRRSIEWFGLLSYIRSLLQLLINWVLKRLFQRKFLT